MFYHNLQNTNLFVSKWRFENKIFFFASIYTSFTSQLSFPILQASSNEHSWLKYPSILLSFSRFVLQTVPPKASWRLHNKDWDYVLTSEPRTLWQASTSSNVILLCKSALRGEIERDKLVFLYMVYYQLRGIYTFVVIFSVSFNVKLHVHFFHRLNSHASKADGTPGLHKQKNTLIEKVFVRCGKKHVNQIFFVIFISRKNVRWTRGNIRQEWWQSYTGKTHEIRFDEDIPVLVHRNENTFLLFFLVKSTIPSHITFRLITNREHWDHSFQWKNVIVAALLRGLWTVAPWAEGHTRLVVNE